MRSPARRNQAARERVAWCFGGLLGLLIAPLSSVAQDAPNGNRFYVVVSRRLLTDVSENDAKAAVKAWAEAIARERNLRAEPESSVADGAKALGLAWENGQADVLALTTDEYRDSGITPDRVMFVADLSGGFVEYLLLVHRDSEIAGLSDLAGRSLQAFDNSRASLALSWLDIELIERGFAPASEHFGRVASEKKLSATILPVFFRQKDACLVTRRGFEVMCELNPQIGRQLRILEASPGLLPSFSAVRTERAGQIEGLNLEREIVKLHRSPAGRQILNLFQSDSMATITDDQVRRAVEVLNRRDALVARWEASPAGRRAQAERRTARETDAPVVASEEGR